MKFTDVDGVLAEVRSIVLEPFGAVVALTMLVQIVPLLLITRRPARLGAGARTVVTTLATFIAHPCWTAIDRMVRFHELNTVVEHTGLIDEPALATVVTSKRRPE